MRRDLIKRLAKAIGDDLFLDGTGRNASRLALIVKMPNGEEFDRGGWGKLPMRNRIEKIIRATLQGEDLKP